MQKNQANDAVVVDDLQEKVLEELNDVEQIIYDNSNYTQLANDFVQFEIPEGLKEMFKKVGKTPFGSLGFTKIVFFQHERKFGNEVFALMSSLSPARYETESYEDYRNRRVFTQQLNKYRPFMYGYPVDSQKDIDKKKARKLLYKQKRNEKRTRK